jgi:hypothetical protein
MSAEYTSRHETPPEYGAAYPIQPEPLTTARDMTRPIIMRSMGVVVSREVARPHFERAVQKVVGMDMESIIDRGELTAMMHKKPEAWCITREVAREVIEREVDTSHADMQGIEADLGPETFLGSVDKAMSEGMNAQRYFPVRLAEDISRAAEQAGVDGFSSATVGDIAQLVRRPDFRHMVDTSAFTANGVWRDYAVTPDGAFSPVDGPELTFTFDEAGNVDFSPEMQKFLRDRIAHNNRQAKNKEEAGIVELSASSGCPARRTRPAFTHSEQDQQRITMLAESFGISPEAVTATDEKSVIDQGLDLLAYALDLAHAHQQRNR